MKNRLEAIVKLAPLFCAVAATAVLLAPAASADDAGSAPAVDASAYTEADAPGWVFFRAYREDGQGCGISPDGMVGCDITVERSADGTVESWGAPVTSGSYPCNPPGQQNLYCPVPPPGANQVVADSQNPARYVTSDSTTFTRDAKVLPAGYRLVNGNAWCYISTASPGGITCKTGDNEFLWSSWGGILGGLS